MPSATDPAELVRQFDALHAHGARPWARDAAEADRGAGGRSRRDRLRAAGGGGDRRDRRDRDAPARGGGAAQGRLSAAALGQQRAVGLAVETGPEVEGVPAIGAKIAFMGRALGRGAQAAALEAEVAARLAVPPADPPVELATSLIGGPFFLRLLLRSLRRGDAVG